MVTAIIDQVKVDAQSLIRTWTGDEFISQTSAHDHDSDARGRFKRLYVVQTRGSV